MKQFFRSIRKPIRRPGAENYILITLVSFALSVALTRLFLQLTGYPQLGGGEYHIAHVLWGGLFLYLATLVILVFANRWTLTLGAVLSGIGIGLFIDEVGKFITSNNNYFHPLAAPIVYVFFLLSALVFMRVRKPARQDPHSELLRALDGLEEVIEHDLEPHEKDDLLKNLHKVARNKEYPELARLARELMEFLESDSILMVPNYPTFFEYLLEKWRQFENRYFSKKSMKWILATALLAVGFVAFFDVIRAITTPLNIQILDNIKNLIGFGEITVENSSSIIWVRLILETIVGLVLIISGVLMIVKEIRGIWLARIGLTASLTTVNLLVFYYNQFSTIILAIIQLVILLAVIHYRKRFLTPGSGQPG